MIWLTWRQLRSQAVPVAVALALLLVALAITGPALVDAAEDTASVFLARTSSDGFTVTLYFAGVAAAYALPAVVGAFWGAPLVAREYEARTHRIAWTQSVTRTRWLAVTLGGTALVTAAVAALLSWGVTWWAGPIDRAIATGEVDGPFTLPRIVPVVFGARGTVPIAYALLALAVGVLAGLVVRRTVAAMGATIVLVVAVQLLVPLTLRAHLADPETTTSTITQENLTGIMVSGEGGPGEPITGVEQLEIASDGAGEWELSNVTVGADGDPLDTLPAWVADCAGPPPGDDQPADRQGCFDRLAAEGYQQVVTVHPSSHFWTLQWRETALLLLLALGLGGLCFWRIRGDAP